MAIHYESGDLFDSMAEALVNPVNCAGTMGRGIAKQFKKRYPECMPPYKAACDQKKLVPGQLVLVKTCVQPNLFGYVRPAVILFPTKNHWRGKSRLEWIEAGLLHLRDSYADWELSSVAMPQVGCGLGGLQWPDVKELTESIFSGDSLALHVHLQID